MKNLNIYKLDAFDFHKEGVASKRKTKTDTEIRERLNTYNDDIEALYLTYKTKFDENALEVMKAHGFEAEKKSDLLSLYNYKSKLIQTFKAFFCISISHIMLFLLNAILFLRGIISISSLRLRIESLKTSYNSITCSFLLMVWSSSVYTFISLVTASN